jgi:hypothetical protein
MNNIITDMNVQNDELIDILIKRIKGLPDHFYHPLDMEPRIKAIDDAWNEYKARFENHRTAYDAANKK